MTTKTDSKAQYESRQNRTLRREKRNGEKVQSEKRDVGDGSTYRGSVLCDKEYVVAEQGDETDGEHQGSKEQEENMEFSHSIVGTGGGLEGNKIQISHHFKQLPPLQGLNAKM